MIVWCMACAIPMTGITALIIPEKQKVLDGPVMN